MARETNPAGLLGPRKGSLERGNRKRSPTPRRRKSRRVSFVFVWEIEERLRSDSWGKPREERGRTD